MSTQAHVLAIGEFHRSIVQHLVAPAEWYEDVPDGTLVTAKLFQVVTKDGAEALAKALHVDLFGYATHNFDPWEVDLEWIKDEFLPFDPTPNDFEALRAAGFIFIFQLDA